jgi:GNAT superfamily N-acetyltransferase
VTASAPRIERYDGDRAPLRPLFELADDSGRLLDAYIDDGEVLVARDGDEIVGHLQLVPTTQSGVVEIKNMAVTTARQGTGIGRALIERALEVARQGGRGRVLVATGTGDVGNLRFYQRLGFRMLSIERNAFTPRWGYPEGLEVDGIPLLDRVWFDQELDAASTTHSS